MARLTIAIPTFNRAELLRRSLGSALAQTSPDVEIIVSDNGSSDGTAEMLAGYDDPRLRKLRWDPTVSRARHGTLIFEQVRTEFILALSDDDYIEPEFAKEVLMLFDKHPECSFVYTGCVEHYDDAQREAIVGPEVEDTLDFIAAHFANRRQISWCACVTRAADLRRLGPQPEDRICGDMFFWTKIAFQGPVGCVSKPISHYIVLRPEGDNESRATPVISWAQDVEVLQKEVFRMVCKYGADLTYQTSLKHNMQRYLTGSLSNQFVWARLSGASRGECLKLLGYCVHRRGWSLGGLLRVFAALILERKLLRKLVVWKARH